MKIVYSASRTPVKSEIFVITMAHNPALNSDQMRSEFLKNLTLDVSQYIQSIPGVVDLKMEEKYGCEQQALAHWEQLYSVNLPEEVKNFYLGSNGLELTWKFRLADQNYPVGKMHINGLSELCLVNDPWKADKHNEELTRLFVLDSNFSQGSIVLLLTKGSTCSSIHYLNNQGQVVQIADNLTIYLRLLILYLGLPDWPLVYLQMDLSYWNRQLYSYFAPHLLNSPSNLEEELYNQNCCYPPNVLDISIFKANKTPR